MTKLRVFLPVIFCCIIMNSFAAKVDIETARRVGISFFYERINQFSDVKFSDISITESITEYNGASPAYYIFNTVPAGFIIISADDACYPVIGYSFENTLDMDNLPAEFKWWMSQIALQVKVAGDLSLRPDSATEAMWTFYSSADAEQLNPVKSKDIAPLLTSLWDQDKYYNQLCPLANDGPDGHALVGCVATSMAQVMYYYRYPVNGLGLHSGINYSGTYYRWNEMVDQPTNYNYGIAELGYHAGKAVNMNYSGTGSGAQTEDIPAAMQDHFRYNSAISYKSRMMYTASSWATLMKSNLDALHPIIYSGTDPDNGGHAWVCDGYQGTSQFHMNWGWSGAANGYFTTDNLVAGGYNFSDWQGMVVNIYPGTGYPYYCTGNLTTITYSRGTIEDGSGISNYQNNNDCRWLIAPAEPVSHITFTFTRFTTESANDVLTIYDGDNISAPVLGTFSGSGLPTYVTSTGNKMLLRFTTNGSTTAAGWLGEFNCTFPQFCSGITTLTTPTGSFDDGSGTNNYSYNQTCRWVINPPGISGISLTFNDFNIAADDYVKIYDMNANVEVANYTGTTLPPTQNYNFTKLMVLLKTNSYTNAAGFSCTYSTTPLGIYEPAAERTLEIFPNPASENINLRFEIESDRLITVDVLSVTGDKIWSLAKTSSGGIFSAGIDVSGFAKGIYFLSIREGDNRIMRRIVVM